MGLPKVQKLQHNFHASYKDLKKEIKEDVIVAQVVCKVSNDVSCKHLLNHVGVNYALAMQGVNYLNLQGVAFSSLKGILVHIVTLRFQRVSYFDKKSRFSRKNNSFAKLFCLYLLFLSFC